MDLQAAWNEMLDAAESGDWNKAGEHAESLLAWMQRNGFPPIVIPDHPMNDDWNGVLATVACKFVITRQVELDSHDG